MDPMHDYLVNRIAVAKALLEKLDAGYSALSNLSTKQFVVDTGQDKITYIYQDLDKIQALRNGLLNEISDLSMRTGSGSMINVYPPR